MSASAPTQSLQAWRQSQRAVGRCRAGNARRRSARVRRLPGPHVSYRSRCAHPTDRLGPSSSWSTAASAFAPDRSYRVGAVSFVFARRGAGMGSVTVRRRRDMPAEAWQDLVCLCIDAMRGAYGGTDDSCVGIDIRRSAPFFRQELMRSAFVLSIYTGEARLSAFAVATAKRTHLYVSLMSSIERGGGRALLRHLLRDDDDDAPRFLVVRATSGSLGFYLKMGFTLFNWSAREECIAGDPALTARLASDRPAVRRVLRHRNWIPPGFDEWPLTLERPGAARPSVRASPRLSWRQSTECCSDHRRAHACEA